MCSTDPSAGCTNLSLRPRKGHGSEQSGVTLEHLKAHNAAVGVLVNVNVSDASFKPQAAAHSIDLKNLPNGLLLIKTIDNQQIHMEKVLHY